MATKIASRDHILEAADRLFMRYGPVKTSVVDIARELGMSPANIYNFFPSRNAILEAVGEQHFARLKQTLSARIADVADPWQRIFLLLTLTAATLNERLCNEKDVIQLQALVRDNDWHFVSDFFDFLRVNIQREMHALVTTRGLTGIDPAAAAAAFFDCVSSMIDPGLPTVPKIDHADRQHRLEAQLALLERAFR